MFVLRVLMQNFADRVMVLLLSPSHDNWPGLQEVTVNLRRVYSEYFQFFKKKNAWCLLCSNKGKIKQETDKYLEIRILNILSDRNITCIQ